MRVTLRVLSACAVRQRGPGRPLVCLWGAVLCYTDCAEWRTAQHSPNTIHIYYNMIWHDMTWYDMTWHDMTWHDMTWHDMTWHMLSTSPSGVPHITHYHYHTQHSVHNNTHNYIQHIVLHSILFDSILFITPIHTLALPSEPSIIDITVEILSQQRGNNVFFEQWKWKWQWQ